MSNIKFKFPSIRQYREVIKEYNKLGIRGKTKIVGHPKIHGSNANICFISETEMSFHSKETELDAEVNMEGFYDWGMTNKEQLIQHGLYLKLHCKEINYPFVISGEWAGGNIQRKASTNGIDKFFAVFSVANLREETDPQNITALQLQFLPLPLTDISLKEIRLFDIRVFGKYELEMDVSFPELIQNKLGEMTTEVEQHCPVAEYFGVKSDKGEGIVWHCGDTIDRHLYFKVKGQKHSSAKVSILASVNAEKIASILEFVEYACTENRMLQAVNQTGEIRKENMSAFLKWLNSDIIKEESDVLETNGLEYKTVSNRINTKAIAWYKSQF